MTPQELRTFRTDLPDCELALYADIGSRTVLGADSALRYPQEYLDALCGCAADLFGALPGIERDKVDHVVFMGQTGGRVFVRNPASPGEVLCCICAADAGATQLVSAARSALRARGDAA
jgi:hypothetical protein